MKVIIWTSTFPTVSETFIRNQVVDLLDQGIDVQILCERKGTSNLGLEGFEKYNLTEKTFEIAALVPVGKWNKVMGICSAFFKTLFSKNFYFLLKCIFCCLANKKQFSLKHFFILERILTQKIRIVHCHFGTNGLKAVFLKKLKLPIKLICTFHGYDIRLGLKRGNYYYKELFYHADVVISISKFNTEKLLFLGLQPGKIRHLNNGVSVGEQRTKKEIDSVTILSVGRLVEDKGFDLALSALAKFTKQHPALHLQYHIIGGGILEEMLKKQSIELGIEKLVTWHLEKNSLYVLNKMKEADFLFLSSRNEALPTVILEAQALGLPVLSTNVGSINELVINDVTGYISPVSKEGLVQGLQRMFENKEYWTIFGANARQNIILHYDRTTLVKKLITIYNE